MAKSTNLIGDSTSVITNGPNAATKVKANAAAGPIMDYPGNTNLLLLHFQETTVLLAKVVTDTDATDSTNLNLLNGLQALLNGTSSPSTQALADIKAVFTAGPNAATTVKANAAAGPIMDYLGNVKAIQRKFEEAKVLAGALITDTDATDSTNLGLLNNINNVIV